MIFILMQGGVIVGHTKNKRMALIWVHDDENTRIYVKSDEMYAEDKDSDEEFIYHA